MVSRGIGLHNTIVVVNGIKTFLKSINILMNDGCFPSKSVINRQRTSTALSGYAPFSEVRPQICTWQLHLSGTIFTTSSPVWARTIAAFRLRGTALIDYVVINGSIHAESSAAQCCAAQRIKFKTRAIRAAKYSTVRRRAVRRFTAMHSLCIHCASHVSHEY